MHGRREPTSGAEGRNNPGAAPRALGSGLWLRPETPADQSFLKALFFTTSLAAMGLPGEAGLTLLLEAQHQAREQSYQGAWPDARRWVIEAAGMPVGGLIEADADAALHVIDIALAPSVRRQGVGRAVIADLQRQAKARDLAVTAMVIVSNVASLALFRALGFTGQAQDGEAQVQLAWRP